MLRKVQIFIIWSLSHTIMGNLKKQTGYRSISPNVYQRSCKFDRKKKNLKFQSQGAILFFTFLMR